MDFAKRTYAEPYPKADGWRNSNVIAIFIGIFVVFSVWITYDYNAWTTSGTGGTPPNLRGYLRMTKFRISIALSRDDLTDASALSDEGKSYLPITLPRREPPRPALRSWTLPQRQRDATIEAKVHNRLIQLPWTYVKRHPEIIILDKSATEGRSTDAIYARSGLSGRPSSAFDPILGNEIAHVHPQDSSLHVWLSEPDARKVVNWGWGERFPLSSLKMVHKGWTFLYAPRSMEEVDVIETIMQASIRHVTGQQIEST